MLSEVSLAFSHHSTYNMCRDADVMGRSSSVVQDRKVYKIPRESSRPKKKKRSTAILCRHTQNVLNKNHLFA